MGFTSTNTVLPPLDGSVTLSEAIDFQGDINPNRTLYTFHEDGNSAVTNISCFEFRRACDRVAQKLRPRRAGPEGELVAVIALSDTLLYQTVVAGMMRAGIVPFPMSPRNTAAATVKMLKETSCHRVLVTETTLGPLITEVLNILADHNPGYELEVEEMPQLLEVYPHLCNEPVANTFEGYPKAAVRPNLDSVALYLHSSGSTGLPKSVAQTSRILLQWAESALVQEFSSYIPQTIVNAIALPPFHTFGVYVQLVLPVFTLVPVALYPPVARSPASLPIMPSPSSILSHTQKTKSSALVTVPAFLQMWAEDESALRILSTLEIVIYGGGALPTKFGNVLVDAGVNIRPTYGGTESGGTTSILAKSSGPAAWEWLKFHDKLDVSWQPQGDGTYECIYFTCPSHQPAIENVVSPRKGYATSDLFIPHPQDPGFWKIVGRRDDVIIHSSGEKTVPMPMENIIATSPFITGVVIFGQDYDQPGVLVELKPAYAIEPGNGKAVHRLREQIWPVIEEANKVAPNFSKIFKELILISLPDKPLPRTGKGTIMRKAALAAYRQEIEDLYTKVESNTEADSVTPPPAWTEEAIQQWLQRQVEDICGWKSCAISVDLFEQGLDSLTAVVLRRRIIDAILSSKETNSTSKHISQTIIYDHPSISKLSVLLVGLVREPGRATAPHGSKVDAIEAMIAKYSTGLDGSIPRSGKSGTTKLSVLVTGTTGNLGAQLMEMLLRDPDVRKIYAFNRTSGASGASVSERHALRFQDKGFDAGLLSSPKLIFLDGDLAMPHLGLHLDVHQELVNDLNVIIHNSWKLDFNLSLDSFEPIIRGTRNLIDLGRAASAHAPDLKFLFTSSIGTADSWDEARGLYPEEIVTDASGAVGAGYGESKYVSERILAMGGLQSTSFRIGQITGGNPNGAWALTDWVPNLIKSSIGMNMLPSTPGAASWIPMHTVAQAIIDVAHDKSKTSPPALNIVHPRPVTWDAAMSLINEALVQHGVRSEKLKTVTFQSWFSQLECRAAVASAADVKDIPAIKLIEFFRSFARADIDARLRFEDQGSSSNSIEFESGGIASFSTLKAQNASEALKNLDSIRENDVSMWVKYWKDRGLFE